MARGYPDFFGQSIFEKYGQYYFDSNSDMAIIDGETYEFIEILGKGRVYTNLIYIIDVTDETAVYIGYEIDGNTGMELYLDDFKDMQAWSDSPFDLVCTQYDPDAGSFTLVLKRGITFDSQFRVYIHNATGANIGALSILAYSSVE